MGGFASKRCYNWQSEEEKEVAGNEIQRLQDRLQHANEQEATLKRQFGHMLWAHKQEFDKRHLDHIELHEHFDQKEQIITYLKLTNLVGIVTPTIGWR